jgi:hypothetical protein
MAYCNAPVVLPLGRTETALRHLIFLKKLLIKRGDCQGLYLL